jgi:large subunit ribosomal protein L18
MALSKTIEDKELKTEYVKLFLGQRLSLDWLFLEVIKKIYAQLVDATYCVTISAASSRDKDISSVKGSKTEIATLVGKSVAAKALKAGLKPSLLTEVVIYYHGRVKIISGRR